MADCPIPALSSGRSRPRRCEMATRQYTVRRLLAAVDLMMNNAEWRG